MSKKYNLKKFTIKQKDEQKILNHCVKLIQNEIAMFGGWQLKYENEKEACTNAAKKIIKYLNNKI